MKKFIQSETTLLSYFTIGTVFFFNDKPYTVITSGKPRTVSGECKTDLYILAQSNDNSTIDIKISYKQSNADFLENKIKASRAKELFGADWQNTIIKTTKQLKTKFQKKKLIYAEKYRRTEKGSITLGWKFEFTNKPGGDLSGVIPLSIDQVIDIYAGTNLPTEKRNAKVNGVTIPNSGIANYILVGDQFPHTPQGIIDSLVPVHIYAEEHPEIYYVCKALNYRTLQKKYDGNRPLCVSVNWRTLNGKLKADLCFDNPLITGGNTAATTLFKAMKELDFHDITDLDESMLDQSLKSLIQGTL